MKAGVTPQPDNAADAQWSRHLSRISSLLGMIVVALVLVFFFFASSICITLVLATFLAILVDPVVTYLELWRMPRPLSAGLVIVAGMLIFGLATYSCYNQVVSTVESVPQYAGRIREAIRPLTHKIQKVQETAGSLNPDGPPTKVTEVKITQAPSWPSYIIRGVGPMLGAVIIVGVVPFLMFFMLTGKEHITRSFTNWLGSQIDACHISEQLTQMVRGYAVGNLIVGSAMATVTVLVLLILKIQGAVILGILSGFLNLVPFLGWILAMLVPSGAALVQYSALSSFAIISLTVVSLHIISSNFLIPRLIGARVNIGPVAATAGILFWGWLWGPVGILLAVPLTAFIKLIADCHPSLAHFSNLLEPAPRLRPRWQNRSAEESRHSAFSFLRRRLLARVKSLTAWD